MPTGIRKSARNIVVKAPPSKKSELPQSPAFHSDFIIVLNKGTGRWQAESTGATVAVNDDREVLLERVLATALSLRDEGGNIKVDLLHENGLTDRVFFFWSDATERQADKPMSVMAADSDR